MFKISKFFVSLFLLGFFPIASGTLATFVSLIILYFFVNIFSSIILTLLFINLFFLSLLFIHYYSKNIKIHDAQEIVIDEFLGVLFIIIFYDFLKFTSDFLMFLIIFVLFRFFDILKPFPINWCDKNIKNSFGIIIDDILASIYCIIVLFLLNAFL